MATYRVVLTAKGNLECTIELEAKDETLARKYAMAAAKAGEIVWKYDGADDDTIEIVGVHQ